MEAYHEKSTYCIEPGVYSNRHGGWSDEYIAAFKKGDYKTAMQLMMPLAEEGDAQAQHEVGVMYLNGHGRISGRSAPSVAHTGDIGICFILHCSTPTLTGLRFWNGPTRESL